MHATDYSITSPRISWDGIPEAEHQAAFILECSIGRLEGYVRDFQSALSLFDTSTMLTRCSPTNRRYDNWKLIAARDGAMTVYHFHRILVHSGNAFKDCPSLRARIDHEPLRLARRRFLEEFPNYARARNTAAHSAEMGESVQNSKRNSVSGDQDYGQIKLTGEGEALISNGLKGRTYIGTHEGEMVGYELSEQTLARLAIIGSIFYSGFDAVDKTPVTFKRRFHEI